MNLIRFILLKHIDILLYNLSKKDQYHSIMCNDCKFLEKNSANRYNRGAGNSYGNKRYIE